MRQKVVASGPAFDGEIAPSSDLFYGAKASTFESQSSDRALLRVRFCFLHSLQHLSYFHSITAGNAHAGSRARVTSMGGLYDAATLRALVVCA